MVGLEGFSVCSHHFAPLSDCMLGFHSALQREFTESLLDILSYPKCMIGPTMVGLEETVSK